MTTEQIDQEFAQQKIIHETARQIVELLDAADEKVRLAGGDEDAARERIIELVTETE